MPRVRINLSSGFDQNLVEIEGQDITHSVAGVSVTRWAQESVGSVQLFVNSEDLQLDADVAEVVIERRGPTPHEALAELLAGVDPAELEQEALGRMNGLDGGPTSPTQAILDVLKEWVARGD